MREVGTGVGRLDIVGLVLKATRWALDRVRLVRRGLRILLAHRPYDGAGSLNITPRTPACLRKCVKDVGDTESNTVRQTRVLAQE